ncbi:MAG: hypothetical protein V4702_02395 [Patescibacteria group bacterium]
MNRLVERFGGSLAYTAGFNAAMGGLAIASLNFIGVIGFPFVVDAAGEVSGKATGLGFEYKSNAKKTIDIGPPTARVSKFSAFITGLATSEFTVSGTFDRLGCEVNVTNKYAAVGTVIAARASDITVVESPDRSTVDVTLNKPPVIASGIDLSKSKADIGYGFGNCKVSNGLNLVRDMNPVAQATADTVGDCILAKPEFQTSVTESMTDIVKVAHPKAAIVNIHIPPAIDPASSPHTKKLGVVLEQQSQGKTEITSTPTTNCEFTDFKVLSLSLSPNQEEK